MTLLQHNLLLDNTVSYFTKNRMQHDININILCCTKLYKQVVEVSDMNIKYELHIFCMLDGELCMHCKRHKVCDVIHILENL